MAEQWRDVPGYPGYTVSSEGYVRGPRNTSVLQGHEGRVTSVAFSPDGALLASCGDDSSVRFWNTSDGSEAALLEVREEFP